MGLTRSTYAFVEFEDPRDAEDALHEMRDRSVDGYVINVQWAKNTPSRNWRFDDRERGPRGAPRRSRSRSPARGGSSRYDDRRRSPPRRDDDREPRRDRDDRRDDRRDRERDVEKRDVDGDTRMDNGHDDRKREASPRPQNGNRSPVSKRREDDD
ncbi:hypothetical protein HK104_006985 [Borealophlyctis nickersoniae]|nr:hypothetical protein HK104_006985 [Borealophlyctis nickersoniae]